MSEEIVKDCLGNEILPGYIISYPVRQSSSMWMSFSVVREVEMVEGYRGAKPKLRVTNVSFESWNATINESKTTVTKLDRVIVMDVDAFNPEVPWQARLLEVQEEINGAL